MDITAKLDQVDVYDPTAKIFLEGPAGTGKTTLAAFRLRWLIQHGLPATSILVLVPQRALASPYYDTIRDPELGPAGQVDVITLDGLSRRVINLFWPLLGTGAGFAHPSHEPVFLTVETAQYFMDMVAGPLTETSDYFHGITIERSRLVRQLLDNLNKAALIGIPIEEVAPRLRGAWGGDEAHLKMFDQAGDCIRRFRTFCLDNNLLDFSLQIETFSRYLYPLPAVQAHLFDRYRHLIVDNLEEDTPVLHDLLMEWVPRSDSALLILDSDGGHRVFLGADPTSAARLSTVCCHQISLTQSLVAPPDVLHLGFQVGLSLNRSPQPVVGDFRNILHRNDDQQHRFHFQMLDWVVSQVSHLVMEEHVKPSEIVILAPFVSDALRFSLLERLENSGIPAHSHRPSRMLRDDPYARCLLTLTKLAHPAWSMPSHPYDVTLTLMQTIRGLDLVRAKLLTDVVYRQSAGSFQLSSYAQIEGALRDRIGNQAGENYDNLFSWLSDYQETSVENEAPIDHFLGRLFGDVLSRDTYGFHDFGQQWTDQKKQDGESPFVLDAFVGARVTSSLIESARKFRQTLESVPDLVPDNTIGARFVAMIERGVATATYTHDWEATNSQAMLIAPAYTYLMTNRTVDYQFWLDTGSNGWWERIYQPLTHPYVLRRDWEPGRPWSDEDEFKTRQETLYRLVLGLVRRCRKRIFLGISELNEQGYEQRGPLLQAVQSSLKRMS